ncbi:hypothetical protein [Streptomyces phaeochromogenes]|uniref:hypothetical protein n=1 Tax=Streptomyces phaeochromogenes TaxID=1923 RepID=UPI0036956A91
MTGVYCFEFEECGVPPVRPPQAELELNSSMNSGAVPGGRVDGADAAAIGPVS